MAYPLTDFLIALADRPGDAHQPGLERALAGAGLSPEQARAVRSRNAREIWRLAGLEAEAAGQHDGASDRTPSAPGAGELAVVGTGIRGVNDLSREAAATIAAADKVLYVVPDPATRRLIHRLNPAAEDLAPLYAPDRPRADTYRKMSAHILDHVRGGRRVCAAFYGHPGVFVKPSHLAIRGARREGHRAYMVPAVSALDWLFADFNLDPSTYSCQIFGATDLLVCVRPVDPTATVIIYQAACVGDPGYHGGSFDGRHLPVLSEYLQRFYPVDQPVYVYEAAQVALCNPRVERTTVGGLPSTRLTGASTLYLPPRRKAALDRAMVARLGLQEHYPSPSRQQPTTTTKENP